MSRCAGCTSEIMQLAENSLRMQETAVADNRMIMEFLQNRDEGGARHAMSIHIRHLINTLPR